MPGAAQMRSATSFCTMTVICSNAPLSPLLPSLPRLDRDALITLAAAFFLLTDGDRGTDWESVILAGILLFLGF